MNRPSDPHPDFLSAFLGQAVVADLGDGFTLYGNLASFDAGSLVFTDADLHNQNEANSSRDIYAIETRDFGIRPNRTRVVVPRWRLVAICRLGEVAG